MSVAIVATLSTYCVCRVSTFLVGLLWCGLHSVHEFLHVLGHRHANELSDFQFQARNTCHQRNTWRQVLPHTRRRRCLIFRVEEETAPTSEVGTGRSPHAWRPNKMCSWLSLPRFHLGSSRRGLPHSDLSQNGYGFFSPLSSSSQFYKYLSLPLQKTCPRKSLAVPSRSLRGCSSGRPSKFPKGIMNILEKHSMFSPFSFLLSPVSFLLSSFLLPSLLPSFSPSPLPAFSFSFLFLPWFSFFTGAQSIFFFASIALRFPFKALF